MRNLVLFYHSHGPKISGQNKKPEALKVRVCFRRYGLPRSW